MTTTTDDLAGCCDDELPVNPFLALRVAYGMLLGVDDFETLIGHGRGKLMLHNAWLHGSGVVWGFRVSVHGTRELRVGPGFGLDGFGRELRAEADLCLDLESWFADQPASTGKAPASGCEDLELCACLTACFDTCLTDPVPALADPCDLSRKHNDYSRVFETVHLELRPGPCPVAARPYHRVRVLLGLDAAGPDDPAGDEARQWRDRVADAPPAERATALLDAFRVLACSDGIELGPGHDDEEGVAPSLFPVTEDHAEVVLAEVCMKIRRADGCDEIVDARVDPTVRATLLPTATIQELSCGLAPGLVEREDEGDANGPRVIADSLLWTAPDCLEMTVTRPLLRSSLSLRGEPILLTSLSDRGWVVEDLRSIDYDESTATVHVVLHDPPAYDLVRLIVRGTGPTPVVGADGVPLAGVVGGPPASRHDGHDAVLTIARRTAP